MGYVDSSNASALSAAAGAPFFDDASINFGDTAGDSPDFSDSGATSSNPGGVSAATGGGSGAGTSANPASPYVVATGATATASNSTLIYIGIGVAVLAGLWLIFKK